MENGLTTGIIVFILVLLFGGIVATIQNLTKKDKKPKTIDEIIASDPKIAKIDKELGNLNRKAADRIRNNPSFKEALKKAGFVPTGGW